jgi:hypothetical protein
VISVPLPLRERMCGLPQASSMIVIVAVRFPTAAGVNVTVIVHFAPTASDVLQVLDVIVKSLLLVPPSGHSLTNRGLINMQPAWCLPVSFALYHPGEIAQMS